MGWQSKRPEPEPERKAPALPAGCELCSGRGHAKGWIEWDFYMGDTFQHSRSAHCRCQGGHGEAPPCGPGWSVHERQRYVTETARASADRSDSWAKSEEGLARAKARRDMPTMGNVGAVDKLRASNWGKAG